MSDAEKDPDQHRQRTFAGMPVSWDWKNWTKGVWNAEDRRLFPPKRVGIGWTINFRELLRRLGFVN
ncbi:MAG: DUF5808 domain-containing protein [Xanthobacteraceae bacterium]